MQKKLKVLFVGLGGIGQRHLRNITHILGDNVEIFAYRKRNAQFVLNNNLEIIENEELNEKYHIHCVASLEDAYKQGMDIVFICNPTSMHLDILRSAVNAKCDVFIEKPVSHNLDGLNDIVNLLNNSSSLVFVGYQNRYHPCVQKAKQLIDEGMIGRIISVQAEIGENVKNWHKYENYKEMYACRKALGGGVILTQIHELDYLCYLFGMPVSVYAVGGRLSDLDIDVEDVSDILMTYEIDGIKIPVSVHEDYLQVPACRTCKIIGTKGKIVFDLLNSGLLLYDEFGNVVTDIVYEIQRNDVFLSEMTSFLDAVLNTRISPIPLSDGMRSLEIALAAKNSIATGEITGLTIKQL